MSGSKAPDFDAYGLLRATHSHNPLSWSITFRLFYLLTLVLLSEDAVESEKLLTAIVSGKQGVPEQVH